MKMSYNSENNSYVIELSYAELFLIKRTLGQMHSEPLATSLNQEIDYWMERCSLQTAASGGVDDSQMPTSLSQKKWNCGCQEADYRDSELGQLTLDKAEKLVREFPWAFRVRKLEEASKTGEDVCPPLLHFGNAGSKLGLQFSTVDNKAFELIATIPTRKAFFGKPDSKPIEFANLNLNEVLTIVRHFYKEEYAAIEALAN